MSARTRKLRDDLIRDAVEAGSTAVAIAKKCGIPFAEVEAVLMAPGARPTLTLIQGGLSKIVDTGGDDVA